MMEYDTVNTKCCLLSSVNWSSRKATNTFPLIQNLLRQYMHKKFNTV